MVTLMVLSPPSLAQNSTDLNGTPLEKMSIDALERQLDLNERALKTFRSNLKSLEAAGKKSSNTARRRAVENLVNSMADKILQEEDLLGQEHLIRQHGKEADQLTTKQVENATAEGRLPKTGRRMIYEGPADRYHAFYRLMRMQEIYVNCSTIQEQAIAKASPAFERYITLATEFGSHMEMDNLEITNLIGEKKAAARREAEADSIATSPSTYER
jgi:hypothetical protein